LQDDDLDILKIPRQPFGVDVGKGEGGVAQQRKQDAFLAGAQTVYHHPPCIEDGALMQEKRGPGV
jgi:hypothetical protein